MRNNRRRLRGPLDVLMLCARIGSPLVRDTGPRSAADTLRPNGDATGQEVVIEIVAVVANANSAWGSIAMTR